jgi:hypothetical protein
MSGRRAPSVDDDAVEVPIRSSSRALASLRAVATAPGLLPTGRPVLPVPDALAALLPHGGLRRGSVVEVVGEAAPGVTSLAMAVISSASSQGAWCAVVGVPELGLVSAAQLGVRLERLALIPEPDRQWPTVVAALVDSVEIVVLQPPGRIRPDAARRLAARVRERGGVLIPLEAWPEPPEVRLTVTRARWQGLGAGHGHLRTRMVEVVVSGRHAAARERGDALWLPGPDGGVGRAEGTWPGRSPMGPSQEASGATGVLVG